MNPVLNEELQRLLTACGRRDEVAFGRLYEVSSAKLFGVALRILKREDWAEEVLQDCYVNIWTHAATYSAGLSAPMTWMTSIVRNRCLDWLRRPRAEVVLESSEPEGDDPLEAMPSEGAGPLDLLAQAKDSQAIAECLRGLEGKSRQAIMLAYFEGLSHSELATHMQQPLGTVKTWVRRGLERLKGCLTQAL